MEWQKRMVERLKGLKDGSPNQGLFSFYFRSMYKDYYERNVKKQKERSTMNMKRISKKIFKRVINPYICYENLLDEEKIKEFFVFVDDLIDVVYK